MERKKQKKFRWVLGLAVIGCALVALSWFQLSANLVYFYTPEEAFAKSVELGDKLIRVGGMVKPGTVVKDGEKVTVDFILTDFANHEFEVHYAGPAPDMFKENQGVVVEGRLTADKKQITAQKLMVKHSEEYKKPEDAGHMDKELLQKSLFKD